MTHTYQISGMTCVSCVARVKSELLKLGDVEQAEVQLHPPQATVTMSRHLSASVLQTAVSKAGHYTITEYAHGDSNRHLENNTEGEKESSWFATYKPVLLIGFYITVVSVLAEAVNHDFDLSRWMSHFMAGFFLSFSFFKLLDLKSFAASYSSYDLIAKRWIGWGYVYAFIELALGLLYLTPVSIFIINSITIVVMSISLIGVLQSVMAGRTIQCACLGTVFNLPMTTVTVVEDGLMIAMSALMLIM